MGDRRTGRTREGGEGRKASVGGEKKISSLARTGEEETIEEELRVLCGVMCVDG